MEVVKVDQEYVTRLESTVEALRIRNGELVVALMEANPDSEILTKPIGYTRSSRLNRVVEAALNYVHTGDDTDLTSSVEHYEEYWVEHKRKKAERKKQGKQIYYGRVS